MNTEKHGLEWGEGSNLPVGPVAAVGFAPKRAAGFAHLLCQNSIRVSPYPSWVKIKC
jgi:hypothetical protein